MPHRAQAANSQRDGSADRPTGIHGARKKTRRAPEHEVLSLALILLIDDDEFYCRIMERELSDARFTVVTVPTGTEGVARYRELSPDLVLTDMHMPEMDGAEVIRAIRAINPNARIIAVSGASSFYSMDYFRIAKEVGADAVVRKLDPLERVIIEVEALLKRGR